MITERVHQVTNVRTSLRDVVVLFKLRIVVLLLFAALGGAFLGAGGWPGIGPLVVLLLSGLLAASGASALNQYIEREKDALMLRTKRRPLITGAIPASRWIAALAVFLILVPVLALLPSNPALSFFLLLGAVIYVGVYTIWLKPRTSLNIVIGGAAGSAAVLSGGAAVGAWNDVGVWLLAALVFFWTPIHFWALALVYREDYARAGVPMLPVQTSGKQAAVWALVHGIGGSLAGLLIALRPGFGLLYAVPALVAGAWLLWQGSRLVIEPSKRQAWRLFHTSNIYLFVILLAVCLAAVL